MNKNEIISAVSIEFGLSKEQSEKVITSIFNAIAQALKKDGGLEIKKFGKFKLNQDKDPADKFSYVKFTPSEKLSKRVNSNFENLKKLKQKIELNEFKEKSEFKPESEFSIPVESVKSVSLEMKNDLLVIRNDDLKKSAVKEIPAGEKQQEKPSEQNLSTQRKLISEDLIKLHKEITEIEKPVKDKGDESSDTNLWG